MRPGLAAIAAACLLLVVGTVEAGPVIFKWIDKKGDLHVTDRLGDVPEPYYSMYAAKLEELEHGGGVQAVATPATAARAGNGREERSTQAPAREQSRAGAESESPVVDAAIRKREQWRKLVAHWRHELELATGAYEKAQADADNAQVNPVLVYTPQGKAKVDDTRKRLEKALARVEKARTMLLIDLPARAKREQVPPKWLE
jgi:hypothetical protein